ncbi:MAG: type IV toxin-antitoxin system AbiEi family antitoxin domain-containing protein [Patescibacteria group bacterium]|nr:type IV toxin-antitoxin system AbiEi family antitoxin domain-containing protein [Patescibacteria group bacterium]
MHLKLTTKPLSHEEQRLYLYLESTDKNTFKISELDLKRIGVTPSYLYVLVDRLEKKGWLTRVGKGVYLRLPASTAMEGKVYLEDPMQVATKMFQGYIAFSSALKVHGLSEYEPFTIYVATKEKSETVTLLKNYEIRAVKFGRRYTGFEKKEKYAVSTISKTFFDCFYRPQYAGGYSEVLKSLHRAEKIDWSELEKYLDKFGSSSLCQKIGYMLSLLKETEFELPQDLINYLKNRVKNKTKIDFGRKGGTYNKEWMIIDNIGKNNLLSWWYNG